VLPVRCDLHCFDLPFAQPPTSRTSASVPLILWNQRWEYDKDPELIPQPYHHDCLYEDFEGLMARLRWALARPDRARALADRLRPAVAEFDWTQMGPRYDEAMMTLVAAG